MKGEKKKEKERTKTKKKKRKEISKPFGLFVASIGWIWGGSLEPLPLPPGGRSGVFIGCNPELRPCCVGK